MAAVVESVFELQMVIFANRLYKRETEAGRPFFLFPLEETVEDAVGVERLGPVVADREFARPYDDGDFAAGFGVHEGVLQQVVGECRCQ